MLTLRDLERMQAEAEQKAEEIYQKWLQGFMGNRAKRGPMVNDVFMDMEIPEGMMEAEDGA